MNQSVDNLSNAVRIRAICYEYKFSRNIKTVLAALLLQHGANGLRTPEFLKLEDQVSDRSRSLAEKDISEARREQVRVVLIGDKDFPPALSEVPDPPLMLFVRGSLPAEQRSPHFCVAIVGMRKASLYGRRMAKELATAVAGAGGVVVSGLARGVDTEAHLGALAGCKKGVSVPGVAVLGSGLSAIYPAENKKLSETIIAAGGAIVSEYGVSATPRAHFFPERNRIISGMADLVIVVEAAKRSGSLITMRLALEQGREVGAVPHRVGECGGEGPNLQLKDGAHLIRDFEDVIDALPEYAKKHVCRGTASNTGRGSIKAWRARVAEACPAEGDRLLACKIISFLLRDESQHYDELARLTKINAAQLSSVLARLELNGAIQRFPGDHYALGQLVDN